MNRDEAKISAYAGLKACYIIEDAMRNLSDVLPESEARNYRRSVGSVIVAIFDEIVDPAFLAFPELKPADEVEFRQRLLSDNI